MRLAFAAAPALLLFALPAPTPPLRATLPEITANENRTPAGTLKDGVLTLRLDLVRGLWLPDGEDQPGVDVLAIAESGKRPSIPGPLVRVPRGTVVRTTLHNTLDSAVVVLGLSGTHAAADTAWLKPGETRELEMHADAAGTFLYQASYSVRPDRDGDDRMMTGALVVDEPGAAPDRVFVLLQYINRAKMPEHGDMVDELLTINGRPWPFTERLTYDLGDTIRWRVINGSYDTHPMHLHGQYFDVMRRGTPYVDTAYAATQVRQDVTERMAPLTTMYVQWKPERAGNWLFHCHLNFHVQAHAPFAGVMLASMPMGGMTHPMGGLVLGVTVRGAIAPDDKPRRTLHLYVERDDSISTDFVPTFSYEREDLPLASRPGAPFIVQQGEPIAITVVNHAKEPTSVHWHGLEIESYYDGVPGFSGTADHMTPEIAAGDSFVVRMTPPRAGTFIYHTHHEDVRQQAGGLYGAFIVVPKGTTWDAAHERQVILGSGAIDEVRLDVSPGGFRVGERYRLRMINITLDRPSARLVLLHDGRVQRWDVVAKDGADLPAAQAGMRDASQTISIGETYDAYFTPSAAGVYVWQFRSAKGDLLATSRLIAR